MKYRKNRIRKQYIQQNIIDNTMIREPNYFDFSSVKLVPATLAEYPIIQNMARFYVYDMSEYCGFEAGWEMPADGLYECMDFKHYWSDANTFPFLIYYGSELAGFVIVDQKGSEASIEFNMAEFFILRKFKNKGIGKQVAYWCFEQYTGVWEVMVMPKNEGAYHFWKSIIAGYTQHNFVEYQRVIPHLDNRTKNIFRFESYKLGLPIEYQHMPELFDAHNVNEQTETKNALIERLLQEQNVKTVLDMTCGTGSQVFYLSERGYEVIGSDFSPALLDIARKKAHAIKRSIVFIDGDMRTLKVGRFDAVITIFNAIGHLIKTDFEIALKNIRANLKEGGLYIFDIFNLQAITPDIIDGFAMHIERVVDGIITRNVQHSEIDKIKGLLTSHDHYTLVKAGCEPEEHTNSFSLQIYTPQELAVILNENGFEIVQQYDMDGNDFIADKSLTMLTVARKQNDNSK